MYLISSRMQAETYKGALAILNLSSTHFQEPLQLVIPKFDAYNVSAMSGSQCVAIAKSDKCNAASAVNFLSKVRHQADHWSFCHEHRSWTSSISILSTRRQRLPGLTTWPCGRSRCPR